MGKKVKTKEVKASPGARKIAQCNCKHEYQDTLYGAGQRVKICNTTGAWNCTVCNRS